MDASIKSTDSAEDTLDAKRRVFTQFEMFCEGSKVMREAKLAEVLMKVDPTIWSTTTVKELFVALDVNEDGVVDFEEFLMWAFNGHTDKVSKKVWKATGHSEIAQQFDSLDLDSDGLLDREEFGSFMKRLDPNVWTEQLIDELYAAVDQDNSGKIKFVEFVDWCTGDGSNTYDLAANAIGMYGGEMFPVEIDPPTGSKHIDFVIINMHCPTMDAIIYYTTDGSEPDESSHKYKGDPIRLSCTGDPFGFVKAVSIRRTPDDVEDTDTVKARYHFAVSSVMMEYLEPTLDPTPDGVFGRVVLRNRNATPRSTTHSTALSQQRKAPFIRRDQMASRFQPTRILSSRPSRSWGS